MPGHYDSVTGQISRIGGYPESWNNISGFRHQPRSIKEANDWYLVKYINTDFDPETEIRSEVSITFNGTTREIEVLYNVTTKTTQEFDDDLQAEKNKIRSLINIHKDKKTIAGFTSDGVIYDADLVSIQKITSANSAAISEGAGFSITWYAKDNSGVLLDQTGMGQLAIALKDHGNSLQIESQAWKVTVEAATTYQELRDFLSTWEGS